jgi:hypothetical protein
MSLKWLVCSGADSAVVVHDVSNVFQACDDTLCNLVAVFGKAREGKSFLLNCLTGDGCSGCFDVSNSHSPCTKGVDLSKRLHNLATLTEDSTLTDRERQIAVGFVDIEGQGDKDVSYDANLICPILLTSKCVIFNWKGELQKDHILSTLGIMARAAQNITSDSHSAEVFNHLHIVFRDWQAANADPLSVQAHIFDLETEHDGAGYDLRNRLRKQILESFASIRVWLFDPPSEYTRDLKQKLTFDKTSAAFRGQVRALREALAQQLREPTYVAGHALTGRAYGPLTEQIVTALNAGGVVLPCSAYLAMMRQELQSSLRAYEAALSEGVGNMAVRMGEMLPGEGSEWVEEQEVAVDGMFTSLTASVVRSMGRAPGFAEPAVSTPPASAVAAVVADFARQKAAVETSQRQCLQNACADLYMGWLRGYTARKQAALGQAVTESAEVTAALFSAAVEGSRVGEGPGGAFEEVVPALFEQVMLAMVSTVKDWLLHQRPELTGAVQLRDGLYSTGENRVFTDEL